MNAILARLVLGLGISSVCSVVAADILPNFDSRWSSRPPIDAATSASRATAVVELKAMIPHASVDTDVQAGRGVWVYSTGGFLTGPLEADVPKNAANLSSQNDTYQPIRVFLKQHAGVFGHGDQVLDEARIQRDWVAPRSGLRTTVWQQQLKGIPVFEALLVGHVTRRGELASIFSGFVSDVAKTAKGKAGLNIVPAIEVRQAIVKAAANLGEVVEPDAIASAPALEEETASFQSFTVTRLKGTTFARLVWLPREDEVLQLCWEVLLTPQSRGELYRLLVDAQDGEVLVRHCFTAYISPASYRVYTNDSPKPMTPGWCSPNTNQPPEVPRTLITLSALNTNASPAGWITDGDNETRGNNVDAHLDRDDDDQPDLPRPHGSPFRVFDFPVNLSLEDPYWWSDTSVVNTFYWCNWLHDRFYELGFTEAAGNFQTTNFARGGLGNDALLADVQDGDGNRTLGDNPVIPPHIFPNPYDGMAPRMELTILSGYPVRLDSALDTGAIIHEYTHGVSERRVGNGAGITALQSWGLWEGWSCFYELAFLSEPGDDPLACYPYGAYLSYMQSDPRLKDYYFGMLRYPVTVDMGKNPLTLRFIDPILAVLPAGIPVNPVSLATTTDLGATNYAEVHYQGEVWLAALWDARANLIAKHGAIAGNQLSLQLVYDGLGFCPPNPTFLQARDAILLADRVNNSGANQNELWAAFAKRGMGLSAHCPPSYTTTGVHEAFDLPDLLEVRPSADLYVRGLVGGPFAPANTTYALTNRGGNTINWSASASQSWVTITPTSGSLAPGAGVLVEARLGSQVNAFAKGIQTNIITFTDAGTGRTQTRWVVLSAGDAQPTQFFADDAFDLANTSLTFTPDGSWTYYDVCRESAAAFPTDPSGGTPVYLEDDANVGVKLGGDATVALFGHRTNVFYIGSNGYLTFDRGDKWGVQYEWYYFTRERMAALMNDLDPSAGGSVSWKQLDDRAAVTFQNVPSVGKTNSNNFQFELFFDGRLRLTWLGMDTRTGLVGLSRGGGDTPGDFLQSDLSAFALCPKPRLQVLGTTLVAEGMNPPDGIISPGETITLAVAFGNVGGANGSNVTVALRPTDQVLAPSASIHFGFVPVGGVSTNLFTFTASGPCATTFEALFECHDGASSLETQRRTLELGAGRQCVNPFARRTPLTLVSGELADAIVVSGVAGQISKVTVTLSGFASISPASITILLEGPGGKTIGLLHNAGKSDPVEFVSLVFDDYAPTLPPAYGTESLTSGAYQPMGYSGYQGVPTYSKHLSDFNGLDANGTWRLRLINEFFGQGCALAEGWVLHLETSNVVCSVNPLASDLQLGVTTLETPRVGDLLTTIFTITNAGPASASGVLLTNPLPSDRVFISTGTSQGTSSQFGSNIVSALGTLPVGSVASVTNVMRVGVHGLFTIAGRVSSAVLDHNGPNNLASITVTAAPPAFSVNAGYILEGNNGIRNMPVQLILSGPSLEAVSVGFFTAPWNDETIPGVDYVPTNGTVVFPPGVTNQTVTLQVLGDTVFENWDLVALHLTNLVNATAVWTPVMLQIVNDDLPPIVSIGDATVVEGNSGLTQAVFTLSLSQVSGAKATVDFQTYEYSASGGSDYVATNGTLEIPAGVSNATWAVAVNGDALSEPDESFLVFLRNPQNVTLGRSSAVGRIRNDDLLVDHTVLLTETCLQPNGAADPGETVTLQVFLRNPGAVATTNLAATLQSGDGVLLPGAPVTYGIIPAGGVVGRTFSFTADGPCGGTVTAHLQLQDGAADRGVATFTIPLGQATTNVLVRTFPVPGTLSIPSQNTFVPYPSSLEVSGVLGTVTKVSLTLSNFTSTAPEPFGLLLVNPAGQCALLMDGVGQGSAVTNITLTFDDAAATSLPAIGPLVSGTFKPTVRAYTPFNPPAPLALATTNLAALAGSDPNGRWQLFISYAPDTYTDTKATGWSLRLETLTPACCVDPSAADVGVSIHESSDIAGIGQVLTYTLTVTNAGPAPASNILLTNWLPAGVNFQTAVASQGTWSLSNGVLRCSLGALAAGGSASLGLSVIPPVAGTLTNVCSVSSAARDVNLTDNVATERTSAALLLYADDTTVAEGNSGDTNAVFHLRLSTPSTSTVSVYYNTGSSSADFNDFSFASGQVAFAPGVTNQMIQVKVHGDLANEPDEQFFLNLTYAVNVTLQRTQAVATIVNDDTPATLSISDATVVEGNTGTTQAVFTVSLSAPTAQRVEFFYSTVDGSAKATDGDYYQISGNAFIFPGGTSATIGVPVVGDTRAEANESFSVNITSSDVPVARAAGTCVILDDEPPAPPQIVVANSVLLSESYAPTNGLIDPGETVTVAIGLQNIGGGSPSITATLLSTGGVSSVGSPQAFGVLTNGGPAVQRSFVFTAGGFCGSWFDLVFQIDSGATNLSRITHGMVFGHRETLLAENFDATNKFTGGWTNGTGTGMQWMVSGGLSDSPPQAAYIPEAPFLTDRALVSPSFTVKTIAAQLEFRQRRALGPTSGGILEIAIGGGAFTDILAAGGIFATGGYSSTLGGSSALAGRMAWTGATAGFIPTVVLLPPSAAGKTVRLAWRFASDGQNPQSGWFVDTVSVSETACASPPLRLLAPVYDGGRFSFFFQSEAGKVYSVECNGSLNSTNWHSIPLFIPGDGTIKTVTNLIPASSPQFYRLRAL